MKEKGIESIDAMKEDRYVVRPIEKNEENVEAVLRIDHEAFNNVVLNNWTLPAYIRNGRAFGLFVDEMLSGYAIYLRDWNDPGLAYLAEFAIDKAHQGKGYATSLHYLKRDKISKVGPNVDPMNSRALHVHQDKFGFRFVEHCPNEYGRDRDRSYLELDLEKWTG
ncbi:MAG: GNAT family N-acetyltransferase [Methanomassiliicoccales archaeon]|nr:GNAT family N-acetyltransferase [Methanomassiliicoccales archaeon]